MSSECVKASSLAVPFVSWHDQGLLLVVENPLYGLIPKDHVACDGTCVSSTGYIKLCVSRFQTLILH